MSYFTRICLWIGFVLFTAASAHADSTVIDRDGNHAVSLRSENGQTTVTDLDTGESITVPGEWEWTLTDEEYTAMLKSESLMLQREREASGMFEPRPRSKTPVPKFVATQSFSVSGGNKGFTSPTYYVDTTWVAVDINSQCPSCTSNDNNLVVTLKRDISFWPDQSYGTKIFKTKGRQTNSWTGIMSKKYYYITISKDYTGNWAYGNYTMRNQ